MATQSRFRQTVGSDKAIVGCRRGAVSKPFGCRCLPNIHCSSDQAIEMMLISTHPANASAANAMIAMKMKMTTIASAMVRLNVARQVHCRNKTLTAEETKAIRRIRKRPALGTSPYLLNQLPATVGAELVVAANNGSADRTVSQSGAGKRRGQWRGVPA